MSNLGTQINIRKGIMKESNGNPNLLELTLNKRIEKVRDDNYRLHGGLSFKEHIF